MKRYIKKYYYINGINKLIRSYNRSRPTPKYRINNLFKFYIDIWEYFAILYIKFNRVKVELLYKQIIYHINDYIDIRYNYELNRLSTPLRYELCIGYNSNNYSKTRIIEMNDKIKMFNLVENITTL